MTVVSVGMKSALRGYLLYHGEAKLNPVQLIPRNHRVFSLHSLLTGLSFGGRSFLFVDIVQHEIGNPVQPREPGSVVGHGGVLLEAKATTAPTILTLANRLSLASSPLCSRPTPSSQQSQPPFQVSLLVSSLMGSEGQPGFFCPKSAVMLFLVNCRPSSFEALLRVSPILKLRKVPGFSHQTLGPFTEELLLPGSREMAQCLKALIAIAEDLGLFSSTHTISYNHLLRDKIPFSDLWAPDTHMIHIHICRKSI